MSTSGQADVLVGRVIRPRGFAGELQVEPLTDFAGRFATGETLTVAGRPRRLEYAHRRSDVLVVLKLEGIDTAEEAEALRGASLFATSDRSPPLPPGQYYYYQLLDMEVYTSEGERLGRICEIMETGSNDVYVVKDGGQEVLIPALEGVIGEVDVAASRMVVDLPPGLR